MREKSDMSTAISQLRPPGLQCFAFSCVPVSATIPPDGRILRSFTKKPKFCLSLKDVLFPRLWMFGDFSNLEIVIPR